jgi:hypothetical protein
VEQVNLSRTAADGFAAKVYRNAVTNEIVISFRGTDMEPVANIDWLTGNFPAALGKPSSQVDNAIQVIADVQATLGSNITLTGHSLGGGLASVMATFFDLPAVTFDEAPFGATARGWEVNVTGVPLNVLSPVLGGYFAHYTSYTQAKYPSQPVSPAFANYAANRLLYSSRASRVSGYYLEGEVLGAFRDVLPYVADGALGKITTGGTSLDPIDLHSMPLLLAMQASVDLRNAAAALPSLLNLLMDKHLYQHRRIEEQQDLLTRLIANEIPGGHYTTVDLLDKLAADVMKVAGTAGVAQTNNAVRDSLIVAAMEYYYFKVPAQATSLFSVSGGGIHFKYSDIGAPQYNSRPRLQAAVAAMLAPAEQSLANGLAAQNAWHIQSGASPLNWAASAGDPQNDAAVGGAGNDSMDSGAGRDILVGGGGDDLFKGGAGNDTLIGGAGDDIYQFFAGDGSDIVADSDAVGRLRFGSSLDPISGANSLKDGEGYWITDPDSLGPYFTYSLIGNGTGGNSLVIGRLGSTDKITVLNWQPGQLGITLSDVPAHVPPPNPFTGDYGKLLAADGVTYLFDSHGNYLPDGAQPSSAQPDDITGTNLGDTINGGAGNDALSGLDGDDTLNGGADDDVIMGGFGRDTINGGAGRDYLYGSGSGYVNKPTRTDQAGPVAGGSEWSRGLGWVAFDGPCSGW